MNIARSVVRDCLHIREDDTVQISTWQHMIDLASSIALECAKIGAQTITVLQTDQVFYGTMLNQPITSLKKPNKASIGLWNNITALIDIFGPENPLTMREIPAERWVAMMEGDKPFIDKMLDNKKRSAFIMLGHVTPQRAKTYGFRHAAWKKAMTEAINVSYNSLKKFGIKVKRRLEKAQEIRVTGENEVDITLRLDDRPVYLYDGVVDEVDIEMGSYDAMLPAGDVSVAPLETSANGFVQFNLPVPQVGLMIQGLKWAFKNGKLTDFQAEKNVDAVKDWWKKAHGDRDRIASLTLGINPKAKFGFLNNSIVRGAVTLGIGDNRFLEGKNNSDYMFQGTLKNATVKLDEKTLIRNGKYTI